jgi:hypothetical protein
MIDRESVTISACPMCGASHTYPLRVERSQVLRAPKTPPANRFTRLFVCPAKQADFQATFEVRHIPGTRIARVEVGQ